MEYKTGSYIIIAQKRWCCEDCNTKIDSNIKQFARVKSSDIVLKTRFGTPYRQKIFKRYHVECALARNDLNDYEKRLLSFYFLQDKTFQDRLEGIHMSLNEVKVG